MHDLEQALGQFILYRIAMKQDEPQRELVTAITEKAYQNVFLGMDARRLIDEQNLRILVFDPQTEEIKQWIP